jgi:osmotically-inducible protein OsmY
MLLLLLLLLALLGCRDGERQERKAVRGAHTSSGGELSKPAHVSDSNLRKAVSVRLTRDPGVSAAHVTVTVRHGVVELSGRVEDLLMKRRAVRVVEAIKGVLAVNDRLVFSAEKRPESEIAHNVRSALRLNLGTSELHVRASAGTVSLTGRVDSQQRRELAERVAEGVVGVQEVLNRIELRPSSPPSDAELEANVKGRLNWDALLGDGLIQVVARSGRVTLRGRVRSVAERRRATGDAWLPGVGHVNDAGLVVDWTTTEAELLQNKPRRASDSEIAHAIQQAARCEARLSDAKLHVDVHEAVATLSGSVTTYAARIAAKELARHTFGVLRVADRLTVEPSSAPADHTAASYVRSALRWDPHVDSQRIQVDAQGGRIALSGSVDTTFQRAQARHIAGSIRGVKDVVDTLQVRAKDAAYFYSPYLVPYAPYWDVGDSAPSGTQRGDAQIAKDIRRQLTWSPFVDAEEVTVDVQDGRAILTGAVDSLSERIQATNNAYAGGAVAVDNRLSVESGS